MKILFATDGSACALSALSTLADHLDRFREPTRVLVLHVHPPLPYPNAAAWVGKDVIARYYNEEGEAALADSRGLLAARDVAFETARQVGDPAQTIVAQAESTGCDLLAMGTQGHGALANLVLGSVTTKVLALAKMPVLLLK
jgi:nucleotide-binding universal stress UspA family protein